MSGTAQVEDNDSFPVAPVRRERPSIDEGEDRPLEESVSKEQKEDSPSVKTIEEKEQEHKHKVEDYKNIIGGILLIACFLIIIIFSACDAALEIDSTLFSSAFEFAKTIATAVIGYLFAVNTKEK